MWNCDIYKEWLKNRLIEIKTSLDLNDYNIEVFNEQDYAKKPSIKQNAITVIIKFLSSNIMFNAKTQPVQLLAISEGNGLDIANAILNKFCNTYNFVTTNNDSTYIKHIYSTPVVLSNFNLIGINLRTVLYVSTTLLVLENVVDITNVKIKFMNNNGTYTSYVSLDPLSATIGYTMTGDTEPFGTGFAKTEKSVSTLVMSLNIACVSNEVVTKCIEIMKNTSQFNGNDVFYTSFKIGSIVFTDFEFKLTSCTISTAKNNVPSIQIGLSL